MQFLWKYIDDMIGKGLSTMIILKLIYYMALTLIPVKDAPIHGVEKPLPLKDLPEGHKP
jgi:hypothetical protein